MRCLLLVVEVLDVEASDIVEIFDDCLFATAGSTGTAAGRCCLRGLDDWIFKLTEACVREVRTMLLMFTVCVFLCCDGEQILVMVPGRYIGVQVMTL